MDLLNNVLGIGHNILDFLQQRAAQPPPPPPMQQPGVSQMPFQLPSLPQIGNAMQQAVQPVEKGMQPLLQPILHTVGQGVQSLGRVTDYIDPLQSDQQFQQQYKTPINQFNPFPDFQKAAQGQAAMLGSVLSPIGTAIGGAGAGLLKTGENLISGNPLEQNVPQAVGQGINFGAQVAPVGEIAGMLPGVNQIAPKIMDLLPKGGGQIGDMLRGATGRVIQGAAQQGATGAGYGLLSGENPLQAAAQFAPFGLMGGAKSFTPQGAFEDSMTQQLQPVKDAVSRILENQDGIVNILKRYELSNSPVMNSVSGQPAGEADTNLYTDTATVWKQIFGGNKPVPNNLDAMVGQIKEAFNGARTQQQMLETQQQMKDIGVTGNSPIKMGFTATPKISNDLQDALAGAEKPQDEAQIIGEFTDNAIRDQQGNSLKATRAALNQELNGIVGTQGNYKLDYAMRQTMKDDPDTGIKIQALEDSIAKIDDVIKNGIQPPSVVTTPAQPTTQEQAAMSDFEQNVLHGPDDIKPQALQGADFTLNKDLGIGVPNNPPPQEPLTVTPPPSGTVRDARAAMDTAMSQVQERARILKQFVKEGVDTGGKPQEGENPTNFGENKLFRQVIEHPETIDQVLPQVKNPEKFLQAVKSFQGFTDFIHQQATGEGSKLPYLQNYYSHILDLSNPEQAAKYDELMGNMKNQSNWFNKPRVFPNIEEAQQAGFNLKNPNVVNDVEDYANAASKEAGGRSLVNNLQKSFPDQVFVSKGGEAGPPGTLQSRIPGLKGTYFTPEIQKQVQNLEPAEQSKTAQALNFVTKFIKEAKLAGGLFHIQNTGGDYLASQAVLGKVPRIDQAVQNFFSPSADAEYRQQLLESGVLDKATKMNITFGQQQDFPTEQNPLESAKTTMSKYNPISMLNRATFQRLEDYFKLETVKALDSKGLIDTSTPEGLKEAQAYGRQINNMFGGQNRTVGDDVFNKSDKTRFIANQGILAPDYQQGRVKSLLNAGSRFLPNHTGASNLALGTLSLRVLGTAVVAEGLRRAISGKFNPNLISAIQNDFLDPSFPTPWQNNGKQQDAHMPATILSDIGRIAADPQHLGQGVEHYAMSHAGAGISDLISYASNQDYFKNHLSDTNNPIEKAGKLALNDLPIPVVQMQKVLQGKEAPGNAMLNFLGDRVSTDKNDPTMQYFNGLSQATKGLNQNEQGVFNSVLHPMSKDAQGNVILDKNTNFTPEKYSAMFDHPKVFQTEVQFQQSQPNHAPLWDKTPDEIKAYMAYTLSQDPSVKAQIRLQNPWIPQLQMQQQEYGQKMGGGTITTQANPMQQLTPDQVKVVSAYTALPKGSMQRRQLLQQNPWLPTYWNANTSYYQQHPTPTDIPQTGLNQYLQSVGIAPVSSSSISGSSGSGSYYRSSSGSYMLRSMLRNTIADEAQETMKGPPKTTIKGKKPQPQVPLPSQITPSPLLDLKPSVVSGFASPGVQSVLATHKPAPSIANVIKTKASIKPVKLASVVKKSSRKKG